MQNFEYASPSNLKEATSLLGASWADAQVLAGGTDLISLMKDYVETPRRVVNIKNIKELGGISSSKGHVRVGAVVTFEDLMNNATIRKEFPSLVSAVRGVSSPQIRNMGTVGGDLCQRPRCWYFRAGNGLLAMKDGKSLIPSGDNRYHAIFGSGPAYFVSASSLGPALLALGAKVKLTSATGSREVTLDKFFVSPTAENTREIALRAERDPHRNPDSDFGHEECHLRSSGERCARLAIGRGSRRSQNEGQHDRFRANRPGTRRFHTLGGSRRRKDARRQIHHARKRRADRSGSRRRSQAA